MTSLTLETLLPLERQGWDALCSSTGAAFYGDLMTDDGLMLLAGGMTLDRERVIASLSDAPPWGAYQISEPRVIPLGPDAAALTYRGRATRPDGPPFEAAMTSVYVLRDGRPRLALYQQTPTS